MADLLQQNLIDDAARRLASESALAIARQSQVAVNGRIFTRFDPSRDIIDNQKTFVTRGLFSGDSPSLSVTFTSSLQTKTSKNYYYEVWNGTGTTSQAQYSVAWGHLNGSGSSAQGTLNDSPSKAIYSQYRQLLLNPGDPAFTFKNGEAPDSAYFINFNRARIKDRLDPGNWQLSLAQLSGSAVANNLHTGSNVRVLSGGTHITLIDDSGDTQEAITTSGGRVFNVVSGSILNGVHNPSAPHYYGLVYPDMGMIVLNDLALNRSASFNSVTGSNITGDNAWKLFTSISGSIASNTSTRAFQARNEETVTSTYYWVRIFNSEYNFSNNPTFTTGSLGAFSQPTFINDPKTYITTIGMYNDRQELLAVAKLSKPIKKSFTDEAVVQVKLDF
jgi:hypothetical protein